MILFNLLHFPIFAKTSNCSVIPLFKLLSACLALDLFCFHFGCFDCVFLKYWILQYESQSNLIFLFIWTLQVAQLTMLLKRRAQSFLKVSKMLILLLTIVI